MKVNYKNMTHKSNFENVFWHIDSMQLISNDLYEVSGWIFSTEGIIKKVIIGDIEYANLQNGLYPRKDVREVYPDLPNDLVGWTFTVKPSNVNAPIDIILDNEVQISNIGTLDSWLVFNSGLNYVAPINIIVVDNFYSNPDLVREYAIENLNFESSDYHRGMRSSDSFILNGTKERFEQILGKPILNWNNPSYANGKFQFCTSLDPIVYHTDIQSYAAMVFLTPNAPLQSGTATYRSIYTNSIKIDNDDTHAKAFKGLSNDLNFYDKTSFEVVDSIANIYNRLIIFDSKNIHAAVNYFGDTIYNSRFFHLFFFDVLEESLAS
jgi:hypothetical protein